MKSGDGALCSKLLSELRWLLAGERRKLRFHGERMRALQGRNVTQRVYLHTLVIIFLLQSAYHIVGSPS